MIELLSEPHTENMRQFKGSVYRYTIYGLNLWSEVPLPGTVQVIADAIEPDVSVHLMPAGLKAPTEGTVVRSQPCPVHGFDILEHRGDAGIWFWIRAVGTFHVKPDMRHIDLYPDAWGDEHVPGYWLLSIVLPFVRNKLVGPTLHASAVMTEGRTIAFIGFPGQGKTTMAASFLRRGAALVTDDALPILVRDGKAYGVPGPPFMKVWDQTVEHTFQLSEDLPNLTVESQKKLLTVDGRYDLAQSATPLDAVYLLERYDPAKAGHSDVVITPAKTRHALGSLMLHTCANAYFLPVEEAVLLTVYSKVISTVAVKTLRYPDGFEYQDEVHSCLLRDLTIV